MLPSVLNIVLFAALVAGTSRIVARGRSIVIALPLGVCLTLCYLCLFFSILGVLGIGFSVVSSIGALLIGCFLAYCILRNKLVLDTPIKNEDMRILICYVLLIVIMAICGYKLFGSPLSLNYETSDPSIHFGSASSLVQGGICTGQFYSHLFSAYFMEAAARLFGTTAMIEAYVISDIAMLVLSSLVAFSVFYFISPNTGMASCFVLAALYSLGYPLNNLVFGFSYLGTGVTIILVTAVLLSDFLDSLFESGGQIDSHTIVPASMVSLALLGLICSYSLFVPAVYLAVFVSVCLSAHKANISINGCTRLLLVIFIFPVILGFSVVYLTYFGSSSSSSVGSSIATEGYIYRDLYSSFVPVAPLAIAGLMMRLKERGLRDAVCSITIIFVIFSASLFVLGLAGYVSSYYFFKCHYVLWGLFFVCACEAIAYLKNQATVLFYSGVIVLFILFSLFLSGADSLLNQKRVLFNPSVASSSYFPIYQFNFSRFGLNRFPAEKIERYVEVNELADARGSEVSVLASDLDSYWFYKIGGDEPKCLFWQMSEKEFLTSIEQYDYIFADSSNCSTLTTTDGVGLEELISVIDLRYEKLSSCEFGDLYILN